MLLSGDNMNKQNVIAIFDVGKTNKKLFLFDENYKIVFEKSVSLSETVDEDGDNCENLESLRLFIFDSLIEIFRQQNFDIRAINFTSYGASLVNMNEDGFACTPLYNYLKPYPVNLKKQFYATYGGEEEFSFRTASPVLGSLNSAMQLYRLKYERPQVFSEITYALHLPQYLSYLITANICSDITSIGCHTNLWDFRKNDYHDWVQQEGILEKLGPILSCNKTVPAVFPGSTFSVGIGIHDSSAALIPYLVNFEEPFVLISTGTWCISLNPFNDAPLTKEELELDCLSFISYEAKSVKASRVFSGYDHDVQVKRIADFFNQSTSRYYSMHFNPDVFQKLSRKNMRPGKSEIDKTVIKNSLFAKRELSEFVGDEEAYHQLIMDIVWQQYLSTQLVLEGTIVKRMFVDGGFSKNSIYMNLLAFYFPGIEIFAASMAQATALGAALAIHSEWNKKSLPNDIIQLHYYSSPNIPAL